MAQQSKNSVIVDFIDRNALMLDINAEKKKRTKKAKRKSNKEGRQRYAERMTAVELVKMIRRANPIPAILPVRCRMCRFASWERPEEMKGKYSNFVGICKLGRGFNDPKDPKVSLIFRDQYCDNGVVDYDKAMEVKEKWERAVNAARTAEEAGKFDKKGK